MENLLSGNVSLRGRKIPILWTGMYAQHVAENYINENSIHPYLHVDIQQKLSKSKTFRQKGSNWIGVLFSNGYATYIPIILQLKYAIIKTCYELISDSMETAKKRKGIGSIPKKKEPRVYEFDDRLIDGLAIDFNTTREEIIDFLTKIHSGKIKPQN